MDLVLTRGREGVKNPENLADIICETAPYITQSKDSIVEHINDGEQGGAREEEGQTVCWASVSRSASR